MNLPETFEPPLSPAPLGAVDGGLRRFADTKAPEAAGAPAPLPNRLLRMGLVTLPQLTSAMQRQAETGMLLSDALLELGLVAAEDLAALLAEEPAAAPVAAELQPEPLPEPLPEPVPERLPERLPEPALLLELAQPAPVVELAQPEPLAQLEAPVLLEAQPVEAPLEAPVHEAPVHEAPVLEAPMLEAPMLEAPVLEAPMLEAPAPEAMPAPTPAGLFAVVAQLEGGSRVELGVYADLPSAAHVATEAMRAIRNELADWPLLGGRYVRPSAVVSVEVTALI